MSYVSVKPFQKHFYYARSGKTEKKVLIRFDTTFENIPCSVSCEKFIWQLVEIINPRPKKKKNRSEYEILKVFMMVVKIKMLKTDNVTD